MTAPSLNRIALAVGVLALAAGGPWLAGQLRSLPGAGALAERSGQRIVTLAVEGLAGADAAARAKEALAALPGVTAVEVRPAQDRAYVVCGHDVADSALTGAVGRAGPGLAATVVAR